MYMHYYMGTYRTPLKSRSTESLRTYKENGVKKIGNFGLVSPLYGGGVEPGEVDRNTPFRVSSIRGNLRYWWRATRGGTFETWDQMREAESAIWGDTEKPSTVK